MSDKWAVPDGEPIVFIGRGLFAAEITDGENKGLPYGLAQMIGMGQITREEVNRRGWTYHQGGKVWRQEDG